MKNKFFVLTVDDKFIRYTKSFRSKLVDDIEQADYWGDISSLKGWLPSIKMKYPTVKIRPCKLTLK